MDCWQVLGIKPTNNLKAIKKAYAVKSREVHPEEHPEEFRALHDSYETALTLAKSREFDVGETDICEEQAATADLKKDTADSAGSHESEISYAESTDESDIDFDEILGNADEEHVRKVIAATDAVMTSLEKAVSYPKEGDRLKAVNNVVLSNYFKECYDIPYFAGQLTEFVQSHHNLTDAFYGPIYNALNFDMLETREQKGMYEELYSCFSQRGKTGVMSAKFADRKYKPTLEPRKPFWNPKARIKELRYFSRVAIAAEFVLVDFSLIWVLNGFYLEDFLNLLVTVVVSLASLSILLYFLTVNIIIFIKSLVTHKKAMKFKSHYGELNLNPIFITLVIIDIWLSVLSVIFL